MSLVLVRKKQLVLVEKNAKEPGWVDILVICPTFLILGIFLWKSGVLFPFIFITFENFSYAEPWKLWAHGTYKNAVHQKWKKIKREIIIEYFSSTH